MILSEKKRLLTLLLVGTILIAAGCGDQPDLPTSINTQPEDFGANDTSFVRVGPNWDATFGHNWSSPSDLLVGYDGRLFVVDQAAVGGHNNGRVVQMARNGAVIEEAIFAAIADTSEAPMGIGQDSRLNLFMVNGTRNIYAWNQLVANVGVEYLIQSFKMAGVDGDTIEIDNTMPLYKQLTNGWEQLQGGDYQIIPESLVITDDPDTLLTCEQEYLFYHEPIDTNSQAIASYTDVDGGPSREGTIFVTDQDLAGSGDKIFSLEVLPARILVLKDGNVSFIYTGDYRIQVLGFGSGGGSTNTPTSIVTSGSGSATAVYFTQSQSNFRVQRVKLINGNWQPDLTGGDESGPTVMRQGFFSYPAAVAVGESDSRGLGLFYVADRDQNKLTSFYPNGYEFRQVAADEKLVDLLGGESLDEVLNAQGDDFDPDLNPDLIDFIAANDRLIELDSSDVLSDILAGLGLEFDSSLNDPALEDYVAGSDTSIHLLFGADTTVRVLFPILNGPEGVATLEGVVYVADTGNDRILRFRRTDSDSYIPNDPDSK